MFLYNEDKTGIVPQYLCESYALAVDWLRGLYSRGYIAREFALMNDGQTETAMLAGRGGVYFKNVWHRYRLNDEIKKLLPNAEIIPIFWLEGPGGINLKYDKGYYGGIAVNTALDDTRLQKLLAFFDKTSDPAKYNHFMFGIEGQHWNMVDGFPQLTELGVREVNNSFYCPYTLATDLYGKVDSPLAPPAYNRQTRELVKEIDDVAVRLGHQPFMFFEIISSSSWSRFWALNETEFMSVVVDVISGGKSVNDLRALQARYLRDPLVQAAMKEFKQEWDTFGLENYRAVRP